MDKNKICEAMYALPGNLVEKRRKPLTVPVALLVAGAAMIVLNNLYGEAITNDLRSALVFTGGVLALTGLLFGIARLCGSDGAPYHNGRRCYLCCDELQFDHSEKANVAEAVRTGNVGQLLALRRSNIPALTVVLYRTPDNGFAAMQGFEYADLEYRPLTDLKIVGGGNE